MVWPSNQPRQLNQNFQATKTFHSSGSVRKTVGEQVDHPHRWIERAGEEVASSHHQQQSFSRVTRSRSRSKNIMERARSFERPAATAGDSRPVSRPASRAGSFRHRSPSTGNKASVEEMWLNQMERPASRTDVDSRRFGEIGRVNTQDWEQRIQGGSVENVAAAAAAAVRTPQPRRRPMNPAPRNEDDRGQLTRTPEPPPPPTRTNFHVREDIPAFPAPPSVSDTRSKLSEESVNQLCEENKERIVAQWVESTNQSAEQVNRELQRFAHDIAESVVANMERKVKMKIFRFLYINANT